MICLEEKLSKMKSATNYKFAMHHTSGVFSSCSGNLILEMQHID